MSGKIAGKDSIRIMAEEIGNVIGGPRLREFERKVRARVVKEFPKGASAAEWIQVMATIIVEDGDTRADQGFRKGIRRIRTQAGQ